MDFLIDAADISVVGQACFTCNCYNQSCYQGGYVPVCIKQSCIVHCWGQACGLRMDPLSLT